MLIDKYVFHVIGFCDAMQHLDFQMLLLLLTSFYQLFSNEYFVSVCVSEYEFDQYFVFVFFSKQ